MVADDYGKAVGLIDLGGGRAKIEIYRGFPIDPDIVIEVYYD